MWGEWQLSDESWLCNHNFATTRQQDDSFRVADDSGIEDGCRNLFAKRQAGDFSLLRKVHAA